MGGTAGKLYLALGDSLAFGYQPNRDFRYGYVDDLTQDLVMHNGFQGGVNMGCIGETSVTMLSGKCPYASLRKSPYKGAQLDAALNYLHTHAGQVALVTLDIGANDVNNDTNSRTCKVDQEKFKLDLATLDKNLTHVILPKLYAALTVDGHMTGRLLLMNYYDPYQNSCPNTLQDTQLLNQHLSQDISRYGSIVDIFSAFGGSALPNKGTCKYTWMCGKSPDIHANNTGYRAIAQAFEREWASARLIDCIRGPITLD